MKPNIFRITLLLLLAGTTTLLFPQENLRERISRSSEKQIDSSGVGMSVRALQANRSQNRDLSDAKWSRLIYRYLDLSKDKNSALYYPVLPEGNQMNLFSMIFKLLAQDKISAYEYLDGRELFSEDYKIDFEDFLNRFGIYHRNESGKLLVDDVDIPGNEVQGYFVKEAYYFETGTSSWGVQTVAICPVIHRQDEYNAGSVRYPLFWIPYEEIEPYALRMPIMTSSLNNSMSGTVDDFFRKRDYDGEIYKTTNSRNLALSQYAATPEEMLQEQEKIERQLVDFEKNLWKEQADSTAVLQSGKRQKVKKSKVKVAAGGSNSMRDRRY